MRDFFHKKSSTGGWQGESKGGYKGGRKFGGGGGWNRGHDRGARPMMHSATCAECGAVCQVPFKPNGRKPVLCSNCFHKDEGGGTSASRYGEPRFERQSSFDKPSYHSTPRSDNSEVVARLKSLNEKMDQVLQALANFVEEIESDGEAGDEKDEA